PITDPDGVAQSAETPANFEYSPDGIDCHTSANVSSACGRYQSSESIVAKKRPRATSNATLVQTCLPLFACLMYRIVSSPPSTQSETRREVSSVDPSSTISHSKSWIVWLFRLWYTRGSVRARL